MACCLLFTTLNLHAMSDSPEEETEATPYTARSWHEKASARDDAAYALKHADRRLLGFATRGTSIPGIEPALKQAYRDQCGLRFIAGFGDLVRSEEQLNKMKLAHAYAQRYNEIIISECRLPQAGAE